MFNVIENDLEGVSKIIERKMIYAIDVYPENEVDESAVLEICKEFQKTISEVEKILTFGGILYKGNHNDIIKKIEFLNSYNIKYKIVVKGE